MSIQKNSSTTARHGASHRKPRVTIAQLFLRAVQRWQRRRVAAELHRLDDMQLSDIGIARNDIHRIAMSVVERRAAPKHEELPAPVSNPEAEPRLREAA